MLDDKTLENILENNLDADVPTAVYNLSPDSIRNMASYLKYTYGHQFSGMTDEDWLNEADVVYKIAAYERPWAS